MQQYRVTKDSLVLFVEHMDRAQESTKGIFDYDIFIGDIGTNDQGRPPQVLWNDTSTCKEILNVRRFR